MDYLAEAQVWDREVIRSRDEPMQPAAAQRFAIERALGYGHVAAALGTLRRIGLDQILPRRPERLARLMTAMIVARVIEPAAKLATARQLSDATASHALGALLGRQIDRSDDIRCR